MHFISGINSGYTVSLLFTEIQAVIYSFPLCRLFRDSDKDANISIVQCQIKAKTTDAVHWFPQTMRQTVKEVKPNSVLPQHILFTNQILAKDSSSAIHFIQSKSSMFLPSPVS